MQLKIAVVVLAHVVLTGCAAGRSVLTAGIDPGRNPVQGTAVRIDAVEDARVFHLSPPSAEMPSVMGGDIGNRAITSRAVGRKRGGFGKALGDVVLPEGSTVSSVVQSAVSRGLRDAGYRVVDRGDPGYAQAAPIKVRVDQFWSWFSPGFASVTITNRAAVNLQGEIPPLAAGRTIMSQANASMQMVTDSDWQAIVNKGLDALATAVKDGVR